MQDTNRLILDVNIIRAAMHIPKRETIREALMCVEIKPDGACFATDGRVMFQGEGAILDGEITKPLLLPYFKLPKKIIQLVVTHDINYNEKYIKVDMCDKNMTMQSFNLNYIDAVYPDVFGMMFSDTCINVESKTMGVNPAFLAMAACIFPNSSAVRIEKMQHSKGSYIFYVVESMGLCEPSKQDPETWKFLIMPVTDNKYTEEFNGSFNDE